MVSIEPSTLLFPFDEIDTEDQPVEYTKVIKLRNVGVAKTRFGIHILEHSEFTVIQQKTGAIFPGEFEIIKVKFSPKSWSVYQGKFYVNGSKQGEMIPVTLKDIPKSIEFGSCLIYEPQVKKISIFNDLPIDFEYSITIDEELPPNYFSISPQKGIRNLITGILRRMETREVSITFAPLTLCQAQMQMTLEISQEEFTPVSCRLYGTGDLTLPERATKPAKKRKKLDKQMHGFIFKNKSTLTSIEETRKKSFRNIEELDLFELELQNNTKPKLHSEICRYVTIGQSEIPQVPVITPKHGGKAAKTNRIQAPAVSITPYVSSQSEKSSTRLTQIFLNAIFTVIYRIRAEKKLNALKLSKVNNSIVTSKAEALSIPEFPHVQMEILKSAKPPKNYAVSKKVDISVPELPELVTKVLIPPIEATFTEKIGWHPLKVPKQDRYLEIEVPPLHFEGNHSEETNDALPKVTQVPLDIHPTSFAKSSIYNPVPGVIPLLYDFHNIHDESSAHYVFHSQNPHNYHGYKKIVELENELRLKIHEMDIGGYGTRLRPLTFSKPKPLVEFANRPMILHQIEALAKVGVKEIVLAVNYQPEVMVSAMNQVEEEFKVKITFSIEPEPLGTAGPLSLARDVLGNGDEPFFVLNSDVICEFPFQYLLDFHKSHGAEGTLMTTPVEDPSKYGVVCLKAGSTQIERFVEKPQTWVGDQINAGIYIFNPAILKRITHERPMSIEKEVFPHMARAGQLHATPLEGFWADVGQPKDFLTGSALYLESLAKKSDARLHKADYVSGNVLVDASAKIGKGCKIGPNVVIGPNAVIGDGVRLKDSVIMGGANVKDFAWINKSIIGWHSSVGRWTRIDETTVLGEDVHVKDEIFTNGATVLPHKSVGANISSPQIVM
ncbi:mannose-1-phosphate guanyltransferase [Boothiomyces sp. JEL0866]|nr:mannose-1-phosphate guanyltransferase [Boothiomyces sp. JEL0866]